MFFGKRADEEKMKSFWQWFEEQEEWIIQAFPADAMTIVDAVDKELSPAFDC